MADQADIAALIRNAAEALAEARVSALHSATTTLFVELLSTLVRTGSIKHGDAIAIGARVNILAAGKSGPYADALSQMGLQIVHALTDDAKRKPS